MKARCPNCDIRESLYCELVADDGFYLRCSVCGERPSGKRHLDSGQAYSELETMIEKEMARKK